MLITKVRHWLRRPLRQRWFSLRYRLDDIAFQAQAKWCHLDFGGHIPGHALVADASLSKRHATAYLPLSRLVFKALMAEALATGIPFTHFLDVGCGKGKLCVLAARYFDFQTIQGIDFSQPLIDIAKRNQVKAKQPRLDFITCDATHFTLAEGNTVVCLFNPFSDVILREFLQLNMAHFKRHASVIAYANDDHRDVLAALGFQVMFRSQHMKCSVWTMPHATPELSYPAQHTQ